MNGNPVTPLTTPAAPTVAPRVSSRRRLSPRICPATGGFSSSVILIPSRSAAGTETGTGPISCQDMRAACPALAGRKAPCLPSGMTTSDSPPLRRKRADDVQRQLLDRIRSGELRPGDALPSERELMASLAVGRVTIREAMQNLQRMGLVEIAMAAGRACASRRWSRSSRTWARPCATC